MIQCETITEGWYLVALINSRHIRQRVSSLMPAGQFGPRDLKKQLWRLEIPTFDPEIELHQRLASASQQIASLVLTLWREVKADREASGKTTSTVVARRTINQWLDQAAEAQIVEDLSRQLIS